jgi:hypothetical protein
LSTLIVTDFAATWTILADLKNSQTTCCALTTSLLNQLLTTTVSLAVDLSGVFTAIADLKNTVTIDFIFTWTQLTDIKDTLTTCCKNIQANFCAPTFITQSSFGATGATPVILNTPGNYKLGENINYTGPTSTDAITIAASNISLDLQCFTLAYTLGASEVRGIVVDGGTSDIMIKNGTIKNFTGSGIFIEDSVNRIKIIGTTFIGCGGTVIDFAGSSPFSMGDFAIESCDLIQCGTNATTGIAITQGIDGRITDCVMSRCGPTNSNYTSLALTSCLKIFCNNLDILDNSASTDYIGVDLSSVAQSQMRDTRIRNVVLTNPAATARGMRLGEGSNSNEIYNCTISGLSAPTAVDGLLITGSSTDNLIKDCFVVSCTATGAAASAIVHGYNIQSAPRTLLINNIAEKNSAPLSTAGPLPVAGAVGFELNNSSECIVKGCIASGQFTGGGTNSIGVAVIDSSRCSITENQARGQTIGFRLNPNNALTSIFSRNISVKNTTNYSQFPGGSNQNAASISAINGSLTAPWTNISIN